jgi:hypothetical protein
VRSSFNRINENVLLMTKKEKNKTGKLGKAGVGYIMGLGRKLVEEEPLANRRGDG